MKLKIAGFSLIAILLSPQINAQQESFIAPLVKESMLLDISAQTRLVAVGERGHVLISDQQGRFEQVAVPTKTTLTAVTQVDERIWAVGHDATIVHSPDAGASWQIQLSMPELDRPFLDIVFFNKQQGIAVGAYGMFYRTLDGGQTWTEELHASVLPQEDIEYLDTLKDDPEFYNEELSFILPHFNRVFLHNDELFLAGEAGLLAKSENYGQSWLRMDIDYFGSFFDISVINQGQSLLAAGLRGNLYRSDSIEEPLWKRIDTCVTTSLNSIVPTRFGAYITGNNGVLFELRDKSESSSKGSALSDESCKLSEKLTQISVDVSDAILNAAEHDGALVLVSASGIKRVEVNE